MTDESLSDWLQEMFAARREAVGAMEIRADLMDITWRGGVTEQDIREAFFDVQPAPDPEVVRARLQAMGMVLPPTTHMFGGNPVTGPMFLNGHRIDPPKEPL